MRDDDRVSAEEQEVERRSRLIYGSIATELFIGEIESQGGLIRIAAAELEQALEVGDQGRSWILIHAILVVSANVSKILFPAETAGERGQERGAILRKELGVSEESILKRRTARNYVEHFDEEVEQVVEKIRLRGYGGINDREIGPRDEIDAFNPTEPLRRFDPETWTFLFLNRGFDLRAIVAAVEEVAASAGQALTIGRMTDRSRGSATAIGANFQTNAHLLSPDARIARRPKA